MGGYRTQALDTSRDVEEIVVDGWRRMSPAQKVQQVRQLTQTARRFAISGIRARHPGASDEEVRRRLASFWLDRETMVRWLSWDPETQGVG